MKIMVSACLMGDNCKYNGGNNSCKELVEYLKDKQYIKVCPECLGGLSTPRNPSEIRDSVVINKEGQDVTKEFNLGAAKTLMVAKKEKIDLCIFKSNSPSCGCGSIYSGNFDNTLVDGDGITTKLLKSNNIKVISDLDFLKNNV